MAGTNTQFTESIYEDIKKYEGVRMPLKAGFLETLLVKKAKCSNLHPNPEDEFSIPSIGPSFRIISEYENKMRDNLNRGSDPFAGWDDPVYIEKMYPEGYMLLNGHHRWAAAMRVGMKRIPVKIVNVTTENDVKQMLEKSTHDKRATLDLDEIVFCAETGDDAERPLGFPFGLVYKEKIRRGIPSLCHFLAKNGYDIWVYTSGYYSFDHIQRLFKRYHVNLTGVITGTSRASRLSSSSRRHMEKMIKNKYKTTLNIYKDMILLIHSHAYEFEQADLDSQAPEWATEVKNKIQELEKNEEEQIS